MANNQFLKSIKELLKVEKRLRRYCGLAEVESQMTATIKDLCTSISVDNYNTYSLNYYDVKQDSDFYEGEITNKKIKVDNYYICCYATSGYNTEDVKIINKVKTNKVILKIIEILLILLIIILFIYFLKINKNNIISKKIR